MITKQSRPSEWQRLMEIWVGERKPGFVVVGGTTYTVFTPNGDEEPVFNDSSDTSMYSSTSTGSTNTASPQPATNPAQRPAPIKRSRGKA